MAQAELAERLGVRQAAVSKLEHKTDFLVSSLTNYPQGWTVGYMRGIGPGELVTGFDLGDTARAAVRPLLQLSARYEANRRDREKRGLSHIGTCPHPGRWMNSALRMASSGRKTASRISVPRWSTGFNAELPPAFGHEDGHPSATGEHRRAALGRCRHALAEVGGRL